MNSVEMIEFTGCPMPLDIKATTIELLDRFLANDFAIFRKEVKNANKEGGCGKVVIFGSDIISMWYFINATIDDEGKNVKFRIYDESHDDILLFSADELTGRLSSVCIYRKPFQHRFLNVLSLLAASQYI